LLEKNPTISTRLSYAGKFLHHGYTTKRNPPFPDLFAERKIGKAKKAKSASLHAFDISTFHGASTASLTAAWNCRSRWCRRPHGALVDPTNRDRYGHLLPRGDDSTEHCEQDNRRTRWFM